MHDQQEKADRDHEWAMASSWREGFNQGLKQGFEQGFEQGFKEGYAQGLIEGVLIGQIRAAQDIMQLPQTAKSELAEQSIEELEAL